MLKQAFDFKKESVTLRFEANTKIHNEVIDKYGGTIGILNIGSIEYLIYLFNKENDAFIKASLVLHNIITNHPFTDGNKRTGFQVAEYKYFVEKIEKWLREKVRPLHSC